MPCPGSFGKQRDPPWVLGNERREGEGTSSPPPSGDGWRSAECTVAVGEERENWPADTLPRSRGVPELDKRDHRSHDASGRSFVLGSRRCRRAWTNVDGG